jgi:2-dehydropantoate 2-reductase
LIVGCGGIGGVTASHLLATGHDVTVSCRNEQVREALHTRGFIVQGATSLHRVPSDKLLATLPGDGERFDYVLLCTQPPEAEAAARAVQGLLAEQGRLVCLQNGLCEPRIGKVVGDERVLGAVVMWGASMPEPGVYDRTSGGGFVLGALQSGTNEQALRKLADALSSVGPVFVSQNLLGARWSKLAINCAISTLGTIAGQRLGALLVDRRARALASEIIDEVVTTARTSGVTLEKVPGLLDVRLLARSVHSSALGRALGTVSCHTVLLGMGLRYRRLRSSMLAAIERSKPAAVDFLNGEVVACADQYGGTVPVNRAAVDLVHEIAAGRRRSSWSELHDLYRRTRGPAGAPATVPPAASTIQPSPTDRGET